MRNSGSSSRLGSQPIPAFCVKPNRFPDGCVSSISADNGNIPAGPVARVVTSRQEVDDCNIDSIAISLCLERATLPFTGSVRCMTSPSSSLCDLSLCSGLFVMWNRNSCETWINCACPETFPPSQSLGISYQTFAICGVHGVARTDCIFLAEVGLTRTILE